MTHIAIRTTPNGIWHKIEGTPYDNEAHLRDLIFEEPGLIPAVDIGVQGTPAVAAIREMSLPGAGSSDIVLVYSDGTLAIIECKLAKNPEMKREVIGQVLDYASALKAWTFADLDLATKKCHGGKSLIEILERALVRGAGWNSLAFKEEITSTLASGTFRLGIVTDQMNSDLHRILEYTSDQSQELLQIYGIEMVYFHTETLQAIVPTVYNPAVASSSLPTRSITIDELREAFSANPDPTVRPVLLDILEFSHRNSLPINPVGTADNSNYAYRINRLDGGDMSLFTVFASGVFDLKPRALRERTNLEIAERFITTLSNIRGFNELTDWSKHSVRFRIIDTLSDPKALRSFKDAVLDLQKAIQSARNSK